MLRIIVQYLRYWGNGAAGHKSRRCWAGGCLVPAQVRIHLSGQSGLDLTGRAGGYPACPFPLGSEWRSAQLPGAGSRPSQLLASQPLAAIKSGPPLPFFVNIF